MSYEPKTQKKIVSFTDLHAWQAGHQLVLAVYKTIKTFPAEERYALGDQMRRSAVSITSNIAEGFGRQGVKERTQFYYTAQGSFSELKNQLLVARDVGYIENDVFTELAEQANITHRLLQGLITATKGMDTKRKEKLATHTS